MAHLGNEVEDSEPKSNGKWVGGSKGQGPQSKRHSFRFALPGKTKPELPFQKGQHRRYAGPARWIRGAKIHDSKYRMKKGVRRSITCVFSPRTFSAQHEQKTKIDDLV